MENYDELTCKSFNMVITCARPQTMDSKLILAGKTATSLYISGRDMTATYREVVLW